MIQSNTADSPGYRPQLRLDAQLKSRALEMVILLAVTGAAALLRFYKLGSWSFWIDEVYNLNYARDLWQGFSIFDQPSLVLISLVLKNFGVNAFNARLVPALIGVFSIPILYFPMRRLVGQVPALLAVLLISLSPWHLHWSQNSRFYTALMLFYGLSILLFYFALEENSPLKFGLSILFLGLAMLERKIAGFWVPVVAVYLLALVTLPKFGQPAGLTRRNALIVGLPVVLFALYQVALVVFASQEWFFQDFIDTFVGYQQNPVRVLFSIIYDLGLPLFLLGLLGGVYLLWQRSRAGLYLFISALLPVIVLVAISPFTQAFSRYVFLTFPSWVMLAALAAAKLFDFVSREGRLLALGALIILLVDPLSQDVLYYGYQNGNRPDWQGAFQVVEQNLSPQDRVVTTRVEIGEYYLQRDVEWTQDLDPREIEAAGQRAWLVIDNRTGFVSPELQAWLQEKPRLVAVKDVYMPGKTMQMRVYRYDPPEP